MLKRRASHIALWALFAVVAVASIVLAMHLNQRRVQRAELWDMNLQLQSHARAIDQLLDRYRVLPTVLALDPELRSALASGSRPIDTAALNSKLEQANGATKVSTLTLIDRHGVGVAANNWSEPASNVGLHYGFRPYFQRAMKDGVGTFYAVGMSTNVPGYYMAEAIKDHAGTSIGVVVVKVTLEAMERSWLSSRDTIMLSDEHGIVFISNQPLWLYRALHPLDSQTRAHLAQTRQYSDTTFRSIQTRTLKQVNPESKRLRFSNPALPGNYFWEDKFLPGLGWTIHIVRKDRSAAAGVLAAVITAVAWLPVIFLIMFLQQRARLARYRQRNREQLEQMVAHHTEALRTAQDSLVLAADQAALGHRESLEHLPHGVSVVDAELRLVAWNTRYQEIFQFPESLMRVGQPIEGQFRYNARRGWFGPEDPEAAIQRRLEYLRLGGPYLHERELPDGTTLEIRGNPLPRGGFVTSYADITTYKTAARDLRTLATTLEDRVEEATRDLRKAKAAAENANHYKARFVAAAVHDLMQPLNAARMFLDSLRATIEDGEGQALLSRIDDAFLAQDGLLASMLDISRLEAGALRANITEFPVDSMLAELTALMRPLAESRGLELRHMTTSLRVRSDRILLRRVLQNFLSNAISYTDRGRVMLGCRRKGGAVSIEVWDTGVGIPQDKQRTVFEEFTQLDTGADRDGRSTGLGLSIVDRIAGLLGHTVRLHSRVGEGSMFSIEVPRVLRMEHPADAGLGDSPEPSPFASARIWYLEQDDSTYEATLRLLLKWGCDAPMIHRNPDVGTHTANMQGPDLFLVGNIGAASRRDLLANIRACCHPCPTIILFQGTLDSALDMPLVKQLPNPVAPSALRALMTQAMLAKVAPP